MCFWCCKALLFYLIFSLVLLHFLHHHLRVSSHLSSVVTWGWSRLRYRTRSMHKPAWFGASQDRKYFDSIPDWVSLIDKSCTLKDCITPDVMAHKHTSSVGYIRIRITAMLAQTVFSLTPAGVLQLPLYCTQLHKCSSSVEICWVWQWRLGLPKAYWATCSASSDSKLSLLFQSFKNLTLHQHIQPAPAHFRHMKTRPCLLVITNNNGVASHVFFFSHTFLNILYD